VGEMLCACREFHRGGGVQGCNARTHAPFGLPPYCLTPTSSSISGAKVKNLTSYLASPDGQCACS
jgi:hypothetical protein